jgi:Tfp pilus assembly protein PilP
MKTILFLMLVILVSAGCGNKVDDKLKELAKKPAPTTLEEAQDRYQEAYDLVRWLKAGKEKATPEQIAQAEALLARRQEEVLAFGKAKLEGVLGGLGIDSLSLKGLMEWFLGNDSLRARFAGPDSTSPLQDGGSASWP